MEKSKERIEEWSEEISRLFYEIGESIRMGEQDKKLFEDFIDHKVGDRDLYSVGHIHAYAEDAAKHILVADKLLDDSREEIHGYIIQNMVKGDGKKETAYQRGRFGIKPTRQEDKKI